MEYELITESEPNEFKRQIELLTMYDWELYGSPYHNNVTNEHCQAMTRERK